MYCEVMLSFHLRDLRESSAMGLGCKGKLEDSSRIKCRRQGFWQSSFTVLNARMDYIFEYQLLRTPLQKLRKATSATIIGGSIAAFNQSLLGVFERGSWVNWGKHSKTTWGPAQAKRGDVRTIIFVVNKLVAVIYSRTSHI
jgi:hypothetical protein